MDSVTTAMIIANENDPNPLQEKGKSAAVETESQRPIGECGAEVV